METIVIGCPAYGYTTKDWYAPLVVEAAGLYKDGIQLEKIIAIGAMMTDVARNEICEEYLNNSKADWLLWIDQDNTFPIGSIRRMLDAGRPLLSGVYVKKVKSKPEPLLYIRQPQGRYTGVPKHYRGEIMQVDSAGFGGVLMNRIILDEIRKNYRMFSRLSGGHTLIHKDDITGDVFDNTASETDGKVIDGVLHERLYLPSHEDAPVFPYFMLEHCRTEEFGFFERAKRVGYPLWIDTNVELGHWGVSNYTPADWREHERTQK